MHEATCMKLHDDLPQSPAATDKSFITRCYHCGRVEGGNLCHWASLPPETGTCVFKSSVPPVQRSHWCSGGCGVNFIFSFSVTHCKRVSKTTAVLSMNTTLLPFIKNLNSHKNYNVCILKEINYTKIQLIDTDFSVLWSVFLKRNFCS